MSALTNKTNFSQEKAAELVILMSVSLLNLALSFLPPALSVLTYSV